MGLRATLFFLCVSLFLFVSLFANGMEDHSCLEETARQPLINIKAITLWPSKYVILCVYLRLFFYHSLLVDLSYIILFLPPNFSCLFVCVKSSKPRDNLGAPTGYGHYFTSSITWSLFHHANSSSSAGLTSNLKPWKIGFIGHYSATKIKI